MGRSSRFIPQIAFCVFSFGALALQAQSTDIGVGSATLQPSVKRLGMNLGQITTYGSQQLYKNLFAANPGFNNTQYQSILYCSTGTSSSLCASGSNLYFPAGFWPTNGSVNVRVLTGAGTGCTTTLNSWSGADFGFSNGCGIAAGDYITLKKIITPDAAGFNATYGWSSNGSPGATFGVSSDAPPAANGTTYTQSLQITTSNSNDYATLTGLADAQYIPWTSSTKSFLNLNGTYTVCYWAKAVSGANAQILVSLKRGNAFRLNLTTDNLTGGWTQYTHTFTAAEVGAQNDVLTLNFETIGAQSVLLNKVSVMEAPSAGNPTVFRDAVVSTLQALKPGVLRMSDGIGLTNTLNNMLVDQWGRMPVNFSTGPVNGAPGYYNSITYSIPEFLQLCQTVGAEAWISIPASLSPAEASELIDYLSDASGNTVGGALRVTQGFSTPWTTALPKIHLELGNEEWNGGNFEGGSMEYGFSNYGAYAQTIFAAMKGNPNYKPSVMSLVLTAQYVNTYLLQIIQNSCNNNDEIDIAPYTANTLTDASSVANIWQPGLAEPQVFWQTGAASGPGMVCAEYTSGALCPSGGYFNVGGVGQPVYGGGMYLVMLAEANSTHPVTVSIYEENNSAKQGTFSQAQFNAYSSAWGAGLEQASEFLTNMQNGIMTQNLFQLAEYYASPYPNPNANGATYVYLFGSVVDMGGPTNLRRPQYLAEQLINSAITTGATMLVTKQTGTPTFSVGNPAAYPANGSTVNTVAAAAVNTIQSFAFNNGAGNYSLVLLNLDVANSQAVTFSGANAPAGTVNVSTLTSANLGDNNETSAVIAPTTSTLNNPKGMTLAPYAMYVLSWNGQTQTQQAPVISNVAASGVGTTSVTVTWNTDQASTSVVNYGTTTGYGLSAASVSALVTSHSVTLNGLTPGTSYDFDVVSANAANLAATSANFTFTTGANSSAPPPYVGYIVCWGVTNSGATISWSSSMPGTTMLAYGTTSALGQFAPTQTALTSTHGVVLTGLNSGTTYYFIAESTGANGATGYSTLSSFTTGGVASTPAPVISGVAMSGVTGTGVTITWTTDQATTSFVNYGTTTAYGNTSTPGSALTTSHSVTLSGLTPGTTYDFDVVSTNSANVTSTSPNSVFNTPAIGAIAPYVGYVVTWGTNSSGITVAWSTNVPATTVLAYGTTPALGQFTDVQAALTSSHGVVLTGLKSGTTYYFVAESSVNGATGYSTVYSFTTN